jgi:hypothetical protein
MTSLTLPCPNPQVVCTNCGASIAGCTCPYRHIHYTVPVCGGCCPVGGEPDASAWERVEEDSA